VIRLQPAWQLSCYRAMDAADITRRGHLLQQLQREIDCNT